MDSKQRSQAIVDAHEVLRNQLLDANDTLKEIQKLLQADYQAHGWDNRDTAKEIKGGLGLIYRALSSHQSAWELYNRARQGR